MARRRTIVSPMQALQIYAGPQARQHIAEYGLFYMNIRQNAKARVQAWQQKQ